MKTKKIVSLVIAAVLVTYPPVNIGASTAVPVIQPVAQTGSQTGSQPAAQADARILDAGKFQNVGVAAAVQGQVEATDTNGDQRDIKSGDAIFLGDKIETGPLGRMQIMLLDQTVFTLGSDSAMVVDEFIFDPESHDGKVNAKAIQGVFRFVTGKIAKKEPRNMEIDLPAGTLGIRGTMVIFQVIAWSTTAILMGPGEENNAGANEGGLVLQNEVDGQQVEADVTKAGFAGSVDKDVKPVVFRVPRELLQQLQASLNPAPFQTDQNNDPSADSGSATDDSGQAKAAAGKLLGDSTQINSLGENLIKFTVESSQDASELEALRQAGAILLLAKDATTLQELGSLQGSANFNQGNFALRDAGSQIVGVYGVNINVDFDNRTVGGGNSFFTGNASNFENGAFTFNLNEQSFGRGLGPGSFSFNSTDLACGDGANGCHAAIGMDFLNDGADLASSVNHNIKITSIDSGEIATGSGNTQRAA